MKRLFTLICLVSIHYLDLFAQIPLTTLPSGGNKIAKVSEQVGLTEVKIEYSRPGVKGREGKIWGQLIHNGFADLRFGNSKSAPWRAGANENTTISFSNDVLVEGKKLPAGKYGFFIAYDSSACTLIFSKNSSSWGSFFYNESEDALRVQVVPQKSEKSVEWLKFEFIDQTDDAATIVLQWEKLQIPFKVQTDYIKDQIALFRNELRSSRGFLWESWNEAAQWCVQHNTNLNEALMWADTATSRNFGGDKSFQAWTTKSQVLQKLNRNQEAADLMKKALPMANMFEVHQYGKQLIGMRMYQDAFDVFKLNYEKYPKEFTTLVGMVRGSSAIGDYTNALKFANQALPLAPDPANKINVETMIKKLKEKKDVNK
jgi:tetratricopeptide (TPR) repeat protein